MARRILVLYAHPSHDRSRVSRHLAVAAARFDFATVVDLYADYPDLLIDIEREQQRLLAHDVVILLHPLYWYSTPAILKEWQDLVLEYGFAYGEGGTALEGKIFFSALSAGGPEPAYREQGFNQFTIRELLQPLEQTANLCHMTYLPPFALFGARTAADDGRRDAHLADWQALLQALHQDRLDLGAARRLVHLRHDLKRLIREG